MGQVMDTFQDYEEKDMIGWIDPRSDKLKDRYGGSGAEEQDDYSLILTAVEDMSKRFVDEKGSSTVVFISLTPVISYREPKEIKKFLGGLTSIVAEMGQVSRRRFGSQQSCLPPERARRWACGSPKLFLSHPSVRARPSEVDSIRIAPQYAPPRM